MPSLRVVMLIQNFHPVIGGAEKQCLSLSQFLIKKRVTVTVLTRSIEGCPTNDVVQGVPVKRLFSWGPLHINSFLFLISSLFYLLIHRNSIDVVHVHLASSHSLAALAWKKITKKSVVIKVGGGHDLSELYLSRKVPSGRLKLKLLAQSRAFFLAVNDSLKQDILSLGVDPECVSIIPNGVDLSRFAPCLINEKIKLKEKLFNTQHKVYLFVGRLTDDKLRPDVMDHLLRAWKRVVETDPNNLLVFVGEGPLRKSYETLARQKGITSSVLFLGAQRDVYLYYRAADVFVLPSVTEGLSNALLEAMACELPVLASDVSGINNLIQHRFHGLLFNPFDENDIFEKWNEMNQSAELRTMFSKNAKKLSELFSLDKVADEIIQVYKKAPL